MEKLFDLPIKQNTMHLRGDAGSMMSTDTYFGCFPCETFAEDTSITNVAACVKVCGTGMVELRHVDGKADRAVAEKKFDNSEPAVLSFRSSMFSVGYLYLRITGKFDISRIWYEGEGTEQNTRITIIICTYRREEYVKQNLEQLSRTIETEQLQNDIDIICVDNGGTLETVPDGVQLIKNRNYGGSGGYARGMMTAEGATHFWLMDDDIRFEPAIIRRAATFLKYRKSDNIRLAAGMFSFEDPTVQQEATAVFDGYTFHSNAADLDFRDREALLKNKIQQNRNTYGGWWSLITPVAEDLPMPFFIKLDDVEYGIRCGGKYVVMNGFGVWHEAFGKKGNAWTEYYTTRNTLITQTLHPELGKNSVKMMGIRLLKALAYGEPKCMEAAVEGVKDYAAGADAFYRMDPEARHKEIMRRYQAPLVPNMTRRKMIRAAVGNLRKGGSWKCIGLLFRSLRLLKKQSSNEWKEMITKEFWKQYLNRKSGGTT